MADMMRTRSKGPPRETYIYKIPTEILRHIIAYLDPPSLLSLTLTNHYFHKLISSPHTWRLLFLQWFPDSKGQFTPLTAPPDPAQAKLHPDDLETNHWRTEAILRSRLLRNLNKARPELREAGNRNTSSTYVEPQFKSTHLKTIPKSVIMSMMHLIQPPITHLFANFDKEPLKPNEKTNGSPPDYHPIPSFRSCNLGNGQASVWSPGNGQFKTEEDSGTMVFTRYEKSQHTLATSFDVMEIVDVHQNGAGSFAVIGRRWSENRVNILCGFRLGTGESMDYPLAHEPAQAIVGIGTGVWIADLAGYGAIPGVGLEEMTEEEQAAARAKREAAEQKGGDQISRILASNDPQNHLEGKYKPVRVPEASGIFSEYGVGLVYITSEGDVHMLSVDTFPLAPGHQIHRALETSRMAKWRISPRCALVSVKVDNDYTPEKKALGRPWCVVQNIVGEIWTFSGDPRSRPDPEDNGLTEEEEDEADLQRADTEIENGPIGDDLSIMDHVERHAAWMRIRAELAATYKTERNAGREEEMKRIAAHVQGHWTMLEGTRVERPISGFYLDDLYRDTGLIVGDNENIQPLKLPWIMEVDFGGYNIVSFSTTSTEERRVQGFRYRLNTLFTEKKPDVPETEILGSQAFAGSADDWAKTRLRIPKSGEEIFDQGKNPQNITALAMDDSFLARAMPVSPNDNTVGGNARLFAVGTNHGRALVFNIRGSPTKRTSDLLTPIRVCKIPGTPKITCVSVTSLAVIVGANNGAISVFDPLGSSGEPVRKIVHAMSIEAKKDYFTRTAQYGWGRTEQENTWQEETSAYRICADPNARNWRGAAILGCNILYWDETDFLNWQEADDLATRRRRRMEKVERLKAEEEEAAKNRRSPRPALGRVVPGTTPGRHIDLGLHPIAVNDEDPVRKWEEAHGELTEEDRRLLKDISGINIDDE
ncbi:hypothetical protein TWF569_010908 [Orbilia oligospora]|uniref:F-box domain-containing protein n=1 Tax=Orbilia oligospora TaxID=2813651 RepID=A0A7C8JJG3_ORBOL|nr:hypothetical protein TWF102_011777 [Orbilia oligospora]KAF3091663.1 hypothetical protein TWF103_011652 [Orbilia oligospora]KAF3104638.1 hypothetical protein TWF706_004432 [Orbilia oligospora]KAF3121824.1 hypothetical protein TWF703_001619 [Orbilia oligospora]KAF3129145.1 hypothetical protein TWF594_011151 [Orbilia oligospora]